MRIVESVGAARPIILNRSNIARLRPTSSGFDLPKLVSVLAVRTSLRRSIARLTVSINSDGTLVAMDLERSPGYKILDAAAQRIVQLAAPYARFPADIRKETDILVITRTWHFARGDKVFSD